MRGRFCVFLTWESVFSTIDGAEMKKDAGQTLLIEKLDRFIRKYYLNRMLRGLLYSLALIVGAYLLITALEAVGRFSSAVRTVLFWTFTGLTASVLLIYIILPLLKLFRLGSIISYEEASGIVGNHFPDVKDKLLNTLQLQQSMGINGSSDLLAASIDQRTRELTPVPFTHAVDLGENRKYLKFALPPLAVLLILFFVAPSFITESTERLIRYNEEIIPQAPFDLQLLNADLSATERDDYVLQVKASGTSVPQKVYIEIDGNRFKLANTSKSTFSYTFRNLNETREFNLYANGFTFGPYRLEVMPRPVLVNFDVVLEYPDYTRLQDEALRNAGDLTVPEGTRISWTFNTRNASQLKLRMQDSLLTLEPVGENRFSADYFALKSADYVIAPSNEWIGTSDSMLYRLRINPDRHPAIAIEEERDSTSLKNVYFTGDVQDDYGFRKLNFNYAFVKSEDEERQLNEYQLISLPKPSGTADRFFYHWSLDELGLKAGEEITYFFEVWDNDAVNGSKSTKTVTKVFAAPTLEEVREERDQQNEDIKDKLEKSLDDTRKLQKELEDLRREMLQKEELGWQEKQKLEQILEKQKALQNQVEDTQRQNEEKNQREKSFQQQNENLKDKQEQLQKLMNEVMNEELKQLYDEIQKLMEELDKEQLQEQVEQMEMSAEDMEKELDRALEQFKQLEWEQKMQESIDELKKLAEEQEKLAEETKEEKQDAEQLKEEQDKLNEEFDSLKEELDKLDEMNKELENPNQMPETEEQEESIEQDMQESSDQLEKKKNKKASGSQESAGEKMKQMAQQMEQSMQQQESESQEEDMEALRALLENIITLSFDQEALMGNIRAIDKGDPKYVQFGQVQRKLKDDAKMVEDSLFALSKRVMQLESIVNREIGLVNEHMGDALDEIGERNTPQVTRHQQYVMTSFNNLALLLDEALQAMQQQMACQKPGQGNCEKPGGNGAPTPSAKPGDLKKMQEQLSKQLEQMKQQMGKQGNEGKSKGGQKMSKELAQMAAQQAAIRQMMEKLAQQLNEDGSGNGNQLKEIAEEMEELEEDIVNKRINQESIERQQDILIRLLKAEEAERSQGEDEKRKSKTGDQGLKSTPESMEDYLRKKEREVELLRTVPPSLKPYYKEKVNDYFNNLDR